MCGIAGFIDSATGSADRDAAVHRMCDAMRHRGPDDAGVEAVGCGTVGMRRLAIFDPVNGHQPMRSRDGRYQIVFNGAIYNFRALRHELEDEGHEFRTDCDTEVLLSAYVHWGESCLHRLRGMFAFAVWDSREEALFFARDAFGIKPLYFRQDGSRFLFASELNALLAARVFDAEIDAASVADYLGWFAVPAPRTIYRQVFSLRPGECGTFRRGQLRIWSAWSFRLPSTQPQICRTQEEFCQELRTRLDDTIRAHVVADVPVGAFLSGGLDSAVITGLMAHASSAPLKTFSIGFAESDYDESRQAAETARHFETDHTSRTLTGAEVAADLPALLAAYDQPSGDGVNTFYVSQLARAGGVTVALSGLGGDELLGGYPSFHDIPQLSRWLPAWHALPRLVRNRVLIQLRRQSVRYRKLADILEHARSIHELCALQRRVFSEDRRLSLLHTDVRRQLGATTSFHPQLPTLSADLVDAGMFEIVSAWELRTYMADVLLRDSDVMSMRHSLELRVPFLDRPFVEWLWRQPAEFKDDRQQPKSALAAALANILPPQIRHRQKRGFTLPFASWMRRELRPFLADVFSDASVSRSGLFAGGAVQSFWAEYLAGNDSRQWSRVWSLAVLIDFANRRHPAATPSAPAPVEIKAPVAKPRPSASRSPAKARRPHRTLLLAPELFGSEGGIPRILQLYLRALCELGGSADAVRFVSLNDASVDAFDLRRTANERLTDWRVCGRQKSRFVRATLQLSRSCDRLICGHVAQLPVALLAKMLQRNLRYYLVAHGIEVWRPFTMAQRMALRGAERILCVSDYTRQELVRRCPYIAGQATVLYNALDPQFEIAPGLGRGEVSPVILLVARITRADRYKGVEHMIAAMPAIRQKVPGVRLRLVGRGDDVERLQQLSRTLRVSEAVDFLGYVNDERMREELRRCAIFALPSRKEGFGLVFLEAMASGRPCIGARAGGIPEVITPETGMLVEFADVPGLATACVAALQREWNENAILNRAREFSYPSFKTRLARILDL